VITVITVVIHWCEVYEVTRDILSRSAIGVPEIGKALVRYPDQMQSVSIFLAYQMFPFQCLRLHC